MTTNDVYIAVLNDGTEVEFVCGPDDDFTIALSEQVPDDSDVWVEYVTDLDGNAVEY